MCGVCAVMAGRPRVTVIQLHSPFLIDLCDFCDALLFLYRCLTAQTDAGRHSVLCTPSSVSNHAMTGAASCGPARRYPPTTTYFDLRHPVAGGCDIIRTLCLPFFFCSFFLHFLFPSLSYTICTPPSWISGFPPHPSHLFGNTGPRPSLAPPPGWGGEQTAPVFGDNHHIAYMPAPLPLLFFFLSCVTLLPTYLRQACNTSPTLAPNPAHPRLHLPCYTSAS